MNKLINIEAIWKPQSRFLGWLLIKVPIIEHLSGVVRIMGVGIYKLAKPGFCQKAVSVVLAVCKMRGNYIDNW